MTMYKLIPDLLGCRVRLEEFSLCWGAQPRMYGLVTEARGNRTNVTMPHRSDACHPELDSSHVTQRPEGQVGLYGEREQLN